MFLKRTLSITMLALPIFITNNVWAKPDINIKVGMDYQKARSILIKSGWKPLVMNRKANGKPACYDFLGREADCNKQYEIESCAPTGIAPCAMHFFDGKKTYLRLYTIGEQPSVDSWKITTKKPQFNRI
ncbi:hypothetical protein A4G19_11335 [Pasteurellaceae bacterium Macca]|nr:hypothetical protein [Pasteurellaceae bacterium Macca]